MIKIPLSDNFIDQQITFSSQCFLKIPYSLNVNEWKFHSPIEWNSCKPLKKEWFCTLNSKFPLIKSENHSKKSELPLIWGVKRRTTRKRIVLRLTPQMSGNSLFLESFSLYMSGNLLFNVQNHSFLSGLQEFHSFGEWNFHSFTFREYLHKYSIILKHIFPRHLSLFPLSLLFPEFPLFTLFLFCFCPLFVFAHFPFLSLSSSFFLLPNLHHFLNFVCQFLRAPLPCSRTFCCPAADKAVPGPLHNTCGGTMWGLQLLFGFPVAEFGESFDQLGQLKNTWAF